MRIAENELKNIVVDVLIKNGLGSEAASLLADIYIAADKYGIITHGVRVLPMHIERIKNRGYNLSSVFNIVRHSASFSVVDGDNSIGPLCANYCMSLAIKQAKKVGIHTVFSYNNNTYGAASYYSLMACKEGLVGVTFCNSPAAMAPIGGYEKMIGTNPVSVAIPAKKHKPIVLDMATSVVAKSKLKVCADKGEKIPYGLALDKNGNETNDPNEAIQGSLLPMSGYKGYGLAVVIDILSGLISGANYLNNVRSFYNSKDECMGVGFTFIAIDPKQIYGDGFADEIDKYCDMIEKSKALDGRKITINGFNLFEAESSSEDNGIEIEEDVLSKLKELVYGKD